MMRKKLSCNGIAAIVLSFVLLVTSVCTVPAVESAASPTESISLEEATNLPETTDSPEATNPPETTNTSGNTSWSKPEEIALNTPISRNFSQNESGKLETQYYCFKTDNTTVSYQIEIINNNSHLGYYDEKISISVQDRYADSDDAGIIDNKSVDSENRYAITLDLKKNHDYLIRVAPTATDRKDFVSRGYEITVKQISKTSETSTPAPSETESEASETEDSEEEGSGTSPSDPEEIVFNETTNGYFKTTIDGTPMAYYYFTTDSSAVDYQIELVNDNEEKEILLSVQNRYADSDETEIDKKWVDPGTRYAETLKLEKECEYLIILEGWSGELRDYREGYELTVTQKVKTPSKPSIQKLTSKKKQLTVQFSKAKYAKSYQIAVKKSGGKWKTYTTTKTSYTIKKLSSKKKYDVKVRAVTTVDKKKYYSSWSSVKSVKVK